MKSISINSSSPLQNSQEDLDLTSSNQISDSEGKKVSFTLNIRGRNKKIVIDPDTRTSSLPNEKRFNLLCSIEAYREEKLKNEIKKLEEAKIQEAEKLKLINKAESAKQKYLMKQKEKVLKYKEDLRWKREELMKLVESENKGKVGKEEKLRKYYEDRKKVLEECRGRKGILA